MSGRREVERTPDGRWLIVDGRRWRAEDPQLPAELRDALVSALGRARSAVRRSEGEELAAVRRRVQLAKEGLGERGRAWWELTTAEREERARARLREITRLEDDG